MYIPEYKLCAARALGLSEKGKEPVRLVYHFQIHG
jgi:hypothetical protein